VYFDVKKVNADALLARFYKAGHRLPCGIFYPESRFYSFFGYDG
jgi:hypothetical protein